MASDDRITLADDASVICEDVVNALFSRETRYQHSKIAGLVSAISDQVVQRLTQEAKLPRKYVVLVTILQKNGAGVQMISSCSWNPTSDACYVYKAENKAMYCIITVYGVTVPGGVDPERYMGTLSDGIRRKQNKLHRGSPHTGGRPTDALPAIRKMPSERLSRNGLSQADGTALHHVAQRLVPRIDRIATRQHGQQAACPSQNRPLPESFDAARSGAVGPVAPTLPRSGGAVGGRQQQGATRGCCTRHLLLKGGETFASRKMMAYQVMKAASSNLSTEYNTAFARDISSPNNEDSVHALRAAFDFFPEAAAWARASQHRSTERDAVITKHRGPRPVTQSGLLPFFPLRRTFGESSPAPRWEDGQQLGRSLPSDPAELPQRLQRHSSA
ncbi:Tctex-1 family protein [Leishmania donovani]|uniref:Tctex-1 family protein n=2 Tax=Leishmania donovani TaxID=5661 RepID=A0A504XW88_LEIDO|nr:Tctex-1 family protein [Leishmania donovani]